MRHDPQIEAFVAEWGTLAIAPLRITLMLDGPIAGYGPLHLDGLLAKGMVNLATNGRGLEGEIEPYWLPLPLAMLWRNPQNGLPLWASTDFAPVGAQQADVSTWHRYGMPSRLVQTDRRGRAFAPRETQGPDKMMAIPLPTEIAAVYTADCIGDAWLVSELLAAVGSHVGKKRSQGFGKVREWQIEQCDAFTFLDGDGQLRRPVPIAALSELLPFDAQLCGWTPPYYPRVVGGMTLCLVPGTPCDEEMLPHA